MSKTMNSHEGKYSNYIKTKSHPKEHHDRNMIAGDEFEILEPRLIFENLIWMNTQEAAQYLRKTVGAIHTAVNRGQIYCKKWRRRLYFRKQDLDMMLKNSELIGG